MYFITSTLDKDNAIKQPPSPYQPRSGSTYGTPINCSTC